MSGGFRFMGEQEDPEMDTHVARGMRVYDATGAGRIPFTQYLRPNGRRREESIERPAEILALAKELLEWGYHFEIEELQDGTVSMDCSHPRDENGPIAIEMCPNGPDVPGAVDRLVKTAHRLAKKAEGK